MLRRAIVVIAGIGALVVFIYYCTPRPVSMEDFELSVTVVAKEILPYEPLEVTLSMRNISWRPVRVSPGFAFGRWTELYCWQTGQESGAALPGAGGLAVWFAGPDPILDRGRAIRWTRTVFLRGRTGQFEEKRSEPGSPRVLRIRNARTRFVFADSGEYWLNARYPAKEFALESKPVRILVREMPADHIAAARMFTNPRIAFLIDGVLLEGAITLAEELVDAHPTTVYAGHVREALEKHRR